MAAPTFALTPVVPDAFQLTGTAPQQAPGNATPVNSNQAQGAPAPADTVTLTNQVAEGQQAGQDPNQGGFDQAAFVGAAGAVIGADRAPTNTQPAQQAPALPVVLPGQQTQNAPAAAAANAADPAANQNQPANAPANNANAAAAGAANAPNAADPAPATATNTELAQLDQILNQLGVNPQSIPISDQLAMLPYANDPAALQMFVQSLQTTAAQQGTTQAAATPAASQANLSAQIQELQTVIKAVQTPQANALAAGATGTALNVTV